MAIDTTRTYSISEFLGRRLRPREDPATAIQAALSEEADPYEEAVYFDLNVLDKTGQVKLCRASTDFLSEEEALADLATVTAFTSRYTSNF